MARFGNFQKMNSEVICSRREVLHPSCAWKGRSTRSSHRSGPLPAHMEGYLAKGPRVVCVGESLFDLISDQPGLPRDQVTSWSPYAGGAPCNVATALAKLGVSVSFLTALGIDERGDQIMNILKESGVQTEAVQRIEKATRDVYVIRDLKGDREFAGFGLPTDTYADCFLDASQVPVADIEGCDVLVTGTLGLAYPSTRAAMERAVQTAQSSPTCKVMVDVNWRPVFWSDTEQATRDVILKYLSEADLIKMSDADLIWLLDIDLTTALINPCVVAKCFPKAAGVLITAGAEGAAYCFKSSHCTASSTSPQRPPAEGPSQASSAASSAASASLPRLEVSAMDKPDQIREVSYNVDGPIISQEESYFTGFVPTHKVHTVDTTGAGDAFTAGFVYHLLRANGLEALRVDAKKLKEAVVFAAACGALTTTKKGAIEGQPNLSEAQGLYEISKNSWYNFW
ncbi:hypothetical protein CEUSTIGMA_g5551.t1 [Chlamydomonas eustigma]|uniref:Carbohydrate kinase PfkB domain-containing protein n=1 Tax=Chlamydomonas eustigma TaxID=1157962 RepID=A0A250X5B2_9CHLO|nr:hypothetical protein CEUSTIGMA_g5551.t1 [Chlamydomonas eustigma]|eukprot:GAX78109.1 hypothetical protein CEUSTIGMA_g5551.t1 [Chlamydomonas eustigma]